MITYEIDLDMFSGGIPPVIHLSQYDDDFTLVFDLFSSVGSFSVADGTTVAIQGTKTDKNGYIATGQISGNAVTIAGHKQMTAVAGKNEFELTLYSADGKELNSKNFLLDVERAALDKDTSPSTSSVLELETQVVVQKASEALTSANAAAESEKNAKQYLDAIGDSRDQAAASATAAANSAKAASTSETNAASSEKKAKNSETAAAASATAASNSETAAAGSETAAAASAKAAADSQTATATSEINAAESARQALSATIKLDGTTKYAGTIETVSELPTANNSVGDIIRVLSNNAEYLWDGSAWHMFGPEIKLAEVTIATSDWTGTEAPFKYDLGTGYAGKYIFTGLNSGKATQDQYDAAVSASIQGGEGTVLYAWGDKPEVAIPMIIFYFEGGED